MLSALPTVPRGRWQRLVYLWSVALVGASVVLLWPHTEMKQDATQGDLARLRLSQARDALRVARARTEELSAIVAQRDRQLRQLRQRLDWLERVLDLRKRADSARLIDGRFRPDAHGAWHLEITLVRGGNHRRLYHTWLQLVADGRYDAPLPLRIRAEDGYERTLAIDLGTHAFVRAWVDWPDALPPQRLEALLLDRNGEEIDRFAFASEEP